MSRAQEFKKLSKDKLEPQWEDRFIVCQGDPIGLLKTAFALTRAAEG